MGRCRCGEASASRARFLHTVTVLHLRRARVVYCSAAKLNFIDMVHLQQNFRPHQFVNEGYIDLYHVYDNLSRTQYEHGFGINCEDPDDYVMNAWHVITPSAMRLTQRVLIWEH
jgi:hypothetical protein